MTAALSLPDPPDVELSAKVQEILLRIDDPLLRRQLDATARFAVAALGDLGRIHLPQDNFEERKSAGDSDRHLDLAPYVMAALVAINRLLTYLMNTFPPPA